MIGFLFSVLFISNLLFFLYNKLGIFNFYILIYLFLIMVNMMIKYFDFIKMQYITNFINADSLINLRNYCSLIGFFILTINSYQNNLIEQKYIDVTSSHLKKQLEEGFFKYWEYYKRNIWLNSFSLWKEIKNRPSFYLYLNLLMWFNVIPLKYSYALTFITNIIYIKYAINYLKIGISTDIEKDLDYLYNFFLLRLKLLLFMIWDIDDYIGNYNLNLNLNYIMCEYDQKWKYYNFKADYTFYEFFNNSNFKVENNKKDLPFYDPDNNIEFFDRLYILIGFVPYNEDPLEMTVYSYFIFAIKKLVENLELRLYLHYNYSTWSRFWSCNMNSEQEKNLFFLENKVKNWIIEFLRESKLEWKILLEKETIENRNWRLLNEIENLFNK